MNGIKTGKVVLKQLMSTTKKMRIHIRVYNKGRFGGGKMCERRYSY